MSTHRTTDTDIRDAARELGLTLTAADLPELRGLVDDAVELIRRLDSVPNPSLVAPYPRSDWRYPDPAEDPLHGWYVKMTVKGAPTGLLAGKGVAIKDSICVAGAPMMVGSNTMEGYVADVDATAVRRVLDEGGDILGKANCEYFCYSAGSHTNATGPTHNPYRRGYSAGGSSSGCAALVGAGQVDLAIGGDQGGSIRQPSAMCGVYGMKPTHGLVPYTGAFPVDHTLDHLGPMTSSVADNALLLQTIAGEDGLDPRQRGVYVDRYTDALALGVEGLRIGLLAEGFGHETALPAVEAAVRDVGRRLADQGALVSTVSVPIHRDIAISVWAAIAVEGTAALVMRDNGIGAGHSEFHVLSMLEKHADWRRSADSLSEPIKTGLITASYLKTKHHGLYYARAQNLIPYVRGQYDEVFADVDLLLMPTIPFTAPPLPATQSRRDQSSPGFDAVVNTAPFNVTGHPAMSVPCGMDEGLPVGAMFISRHWDESTIYRAAAALEASGSWHDW
jgi:amidase